MRLLLQHRSSYRYDEAAELGPHVVRLRPAFHARARIEEYALRVQQACKLLWRHDAYGNDIARLVFEEPVTALELEVELRVEIQPVNPFNLFLDERCKALPFEYPPELLHELTPILDTSHESVASGPLYEEFDARLPKAGPTVDTLVELLGAVKGEISDVIRNEAGGPGPPRRL